MIQATTMAELEQKLFAQPLPDEVIKEMLFAMFRIEREFGIGGNAEPPVAFVILAKSEKGRERIQSKFGLTGRTPDDRGILYADSTAMWFSEVYADEGGGEIALFTRFACQYGKHTQTARNTSPRYE